MSESRRVSNLRSTIAIGAAQGLARVVPFILYLYLLGVVGTENLGRIAFFHSIAALVGMLVAFGIEISGAKRVARIAASPGGLSELVWSVLVLRLVLLGMASAIVYVGTLIVPTLSEQRLLLLAGTPMFLSYALSPEWVFLGLERMRAFLVAAAAGAAGTLALVFIFVREPDHYVLVPFFQGGAVSMAYIVGYWFLARSLPLRASRPRIRSIMDLARESASVFLSTIASGVMYRAPALWLGGFGMYGQLGIYTVAEKLIEGLKIPLFALHRAWFPYLARVSSESSSLFVREWARLWRIGLSLAVLLAIGVVFIPQEFLAIIISENPQEIGALLGVFGMVIVTYHAINSQGINWLFHFGEERRTALLQVAVSVPAVAGIAVAARLGGAIGVVVALVVAELVIIWSRWFLILIVRKSR